MRDYEFYKYEGCGNDYIYIDCFDYEPPEPEKERLARVLSDRHFGVGGDGVVFICPSSVADGKMRMFNSDGSEGRMCGNAVRCVCKYLFERRNVRSPHVFVETLSGVKDIVPVLEGGSVAAATVDMGAPVFDPKAVPALFPGNRVIGAEADLDIKRVITLVSMGNPHCVIFTSGVGDMDVETPGRIIENHALFPDRINVEFAEVVSPSRVIMRVWERGSGETLACGTGACATAVAMVENGISPAGTDITVMLRGGELTINYGDVVRMTGPAREVFSGRIRI